MSRTAVILGAAVFAVFAIAIAIPAAAADEPKNAAPNNDVKTDLNTDSTPPVTCASGVPGGISCIVTRKDRKQAEAAYLRGMKLQEHHELNDAYEQFDEATHIVPQDARFLTARELVKGQLVYDHIERGNALLMSNSRPAAAREFRAALDLDPENQFAHDRLVEATFDPVAQRRLNQPIQLKYASEIRLDPKKENATFRFEGDVRGLFAVLASAYGIDIQFDESVQNRPVRFVIDDVDFFTALKMACEVSKTMWTALGPHQMLIALDNRENHLQFDRMSLGTLIMPPHTTEKDGTDFVNTLKTFFELKYVVPGQVANTIEIRAPHKTLEDCAKFLSQLDNQKPQVMVDVRVFEIDHQFMREIGMHTPDTFNLYNIPVGALAALGGQNIQSLINQLISSGGINQAGSTALSGLLAQLQGQGNSIFSQPLATFGGGLTFSGLSLDHLTAALSLNESWSRSLESLGVRGTDGQKSSFHVGSRYPIMNASYAPIYNSPQIAQVLGNQSYIPPIPSISYEEIGLNVEFTPRIHADSVTLDLKMQVRSLTGQSNNGVPVISNREYEGGINLKMGEPAVIAGEVSRTDEIAMTGVPGLGSLPGLNQALEDNTKEEDSDELMIVILPRIVSTVDRGSREIWLSSN
jgi:general secretion pathway protein D